MSRPPPIHEVAGVRARAVLVVTGQLARDDVAKYVKEVAEVATTVVALPRPVAALMSLKYIARELRRLELRGFDLVLIPGMIPGDASWLSEELGVRVFKGPRHAADLPIVLRALARGAELSTTRPACELLREEVVKEAQRMLSEAEKMVDRGRALRLGRGRRALWVGGGAPLRVFAEVLDAPLLRLEEVLAKAEWFRRCGADVVDLGMLSEEPRPGRVRRLVKALKRRGFLVSVDTVDFSEVVEAVKAGVDVVLSLTPSAVERAEGLADVAGGRRAVYVVVPYEPGGRAALKAEERVEALAEAVRRLRQAGLRKLMVDPLLDPPVSPGCLEGLMACRRWVAKVSKVPVLLGVGNVTELIDADSHGVNAVLAALAVEAGASAILTAEGSDKTRGCVREAVVAARMAWLAKMRRSPPKDLGLDLLVVKEKRRRGLGVELPEKVIEAVELEEPRRDPAGSFRLGVVEDKELLAAIHYPAGSATPDLAVVASRALQIRDALVKLRLVSDLKHAFYLGYELAKAEVALKLKKSYVQDEDVV